MTRLERLTHQAEFAASAAGEVACIWLVFTAPEPAKPIIGILMAVFATIALAKMNKAFE